jgi:hypothetical protein
MVNMSGVWDRAAEFLGDNLATILPIALLAFFVPASIEGSLPDPATVEGTALPLLLSLLSIGFSILSLWGSLAIVAMAGRPDAGYAGAVARRRLLPALAVWVALFAVVMLLTLPLPFALWLNGYDLDAIARMQNVEISAAMAWPLILYGFVLAALLLWAAARLLLVSPLIVHERRFFDAIPRSLALTRGLTWRIIGVILLFAIVSIVAVFATRVVFDPIFRLVTGNDDGGITLAGVLTSVMVAAVQTLFTVIPPAFATKLYLALVSAREGASPAA